MDKNNNNIIDFIVYVILIIALVNIFITIRNFRPYRLKRDIINDYYDQTCIKEILMEKLGEDYSNNIDEDFNVFVNQLITEKINSISQ
ncbi:MAG: hypothetical protein GX175_04660 [Halanaerobiaceae bacterium]|nr:hypothetical protein [Halanaerobiaceae bacterium]